MAAKYHVELIIGTGELPPLLDYLVDKAYRVEIRPFSGPDEQPVFPRQKRGPKKRGPYKKRKDKRLWGGGHPKIPGGIRGLLLGAMQAGPVSYKDISRMLQQYGYEPHSSGGALYRMIQSGEIVRAGTSPALYALGKELKSG